MEKKKIKEAAALKYSPQKGGAPEIVALGKGEIAEKIIEKALENEVPLYEDATLAHTLNYLKIGDEIPEELYGVVAQIMVFVSQLDSSYENKWDRLSEYQLDRMYEQKRGKGEYNE